MTARGLQEAPPLYIPSLFFDQLDQLRGGMEVSLYEGCVTRPEGRGGYVGRVSGRYVDGRWKRNGLCALCYPGGLGRGEAGWLMFVWMASWVLLLPTGPTAALP